MRQFEAVRDAREIFHSRVVDFDEDTGEPTMSHTDCMNLVLGLQKRIKVYLDEYPLIEPVTTTK